MNQKRNRKREKQQKQAQHTRTHRHWNGIRQEIIKLRLRVTRYEYKNRIHRSNTVFFVKDICVKQKHLVPVPRIYNIFSYRSSFVFLHFFEKSISETNLFVVQSFSVCIAIVSPKVCESVSLSSVKVKSIRKQCRRVDPLKINWIRSRRAPRLVETLEFRLCLFSRKEQNVLNFPFLRRQ